MVSWWCQKRQNSVENGKVATMTMAAVLATATEAATAVVLVVPCAVHR